MAAFLRERNGGERVNDGGMSFGVAARIASCIARRIASRVASRVAPRITPRLTLPLAIAFLLCGPAPSRAEDPSSPPPESPAAGAASPLEPPGHVRGQALDRGLAQAVEMAREVAGVGAGYEAARILAGIHRFAPESEAGRAAKAILVEWGVFGRPLGDGTAVEVSDAIRRRLEANESVLELLARAKILLEFGDHAEAADLLVKASRLRPNGASKTRYEAFLGHYALGSDGAKPIEDLDAASAAARVAHGRDVARLCDLGKFLEDADPDSGRVFQSLLAHALPESRLRKRDEESEMGGFPFGGRGARGPGGMGGMRGGGQMQFFGGPGGPGGFGGGGRDAGPGPMIREFENRIARGAGPERVDAAPPAAPKERPPLAPLASAAESLEAARRLIARDRDAAGDLVRLAVKAHGEDPSAGDLRALLATLELPASTDHFPPGEAGPPDEKNTEKENTEKKSIEKKIPEKKTTEKKTTEKESVEGKRPEEKPEEKGAEKANGAKTEKKKKTFPKKGRASDAVFAEGTVHFYEIEMSPEALTSLKTAPREYVRAAFRSGEDFLRDVGVSVKGSVGTFRPIDGESKTGLTVKFDQFVDGQKFHGLKKIILNNAAQAPGYLTDTMTNSVFRDAGLPAPRVAYANVALNGRHNGLYVQVEAATGDFLDRWFEDADGDLYEGPGDITRWEEMDADAGGKGAKRERLKALAEAAEKVANGAPLAELGNHMDLDRLARYLAAEGLVGHWDGYLSPNNYRIYFDPAADRFTLIPHGVDNTLADPRADAFQRGRGVLSRALLASVEGKALYRGAMEEVLKAAWEPARLLARAERTFRAIRPHLVDDPRLPLSLASVEEAVYRTLSFLAERRRFASWQIAAQSDSALAERLSRIQRPIGPFFGRGGPGGDRFRGPGDRR